MKKISCITLCGIAALTMLGCRNSNTTINKSALLNNPLFMERYAEEMVESLVELKIQGDPILEDKKIEKAVDKERLKWMEKAKEARNMQKSGRSGHFIEVDKYITGEVLYLENEIYFDTLFEVTPNLELRLHITTAVDPRDMEFPDKTSIDLGELQSTYGAQTYRVPKMKNTLLYRTVVIWDKELKKIHGFTQLSQR